jgi:hypothetical protein
MGSGSVIFTAIIWVISVFLLWYAWKQAKNGVLR